MKCTTQKRRNNILIDLSFGELPCRANNTPDNGGGPEHFSARADETVFLIRIAHVWNVGEHPRLYTELHRPGNDCSNNLSPEHRSRSGIKCEKISSMMKSKRTESSCNDQA